jgi:hypothetical protein
MEARLFRAALVAATLLSLGASYRTQNFLVTAPTAQLAREIGDAAEVYRRDLAVQWLGRQLQPWTQPCPITAQVGPMGAGGATSFVFEGGRPNGWQMSIQGSRERILDSVLPHEITHTVFATHFGRPLPRWADEGACTTVEHVSERTKQHRLLLQFLTSVPTRGIAFNQMFAMKDYPPDILPLYAQGYSLARFLISQGGKHKFVAFVGDGMRGNNWTAATRGHYGYQNLSDLQVKWLDWLRSGCPDRPSAGTLALATGPAPGREAEPRGEIGGGARRGEGVQATDELVSVPGPSQEPPITLIGGASTAPGNKIDLTGASRSGHDSGDSWYLRRPSRDGGSKSPSLEAQSNATPSPRRHASSPIVQDSHRSVSRAQSLESAREIILEWGQPAGNDSLLTAPSAVVAPIATPRRSYQDASLRTNDSIRR